MSTRKGTITTATKELSETKLQVESGLGSYLTDEAVYSVLSALYQGLHIKNKPLDVMSLAERRDMLEKLTVHGKKEDRAFARLSSDPAALINKVESEEGLEYVMQGFAALCPSELSRVSHIAVQTTPESNGSSASKAASTPQSAYKGSNASGRKSLDLGKQEEVKKGAATKELFRSKPLPAPAAAPAPVEPSKMLAKKKDKHKGMDVDKEGGTPLRQVKPILPLKGTIKQSSGRLTFKTARPAELGDLDMEKIQAISSQTGGGKTPGKTGQPKPQEGIDTPAHLTTKVDGFKKTPAGSTTKRDTVKEATALAIAERKKHLADLLKNAATGDDIDEHEEDDHDHDQDGGAEDQDGSEEEEEEEDDESSEVEVQVEDQAGKTSNVLFPDNESESESEFVTIKRDALQGLEERLLRVEAQMAGLLLGSGVSGTTPLTTTDTKATADMMKKRASSAATRK